jgi:hypothetical protein
MKRLIAITLSTVCMAAPAKACIFKYVLGVSPSEIYEPATGISDWGPDQRFKSTEHLNAGDQVCVVKIGDDGWVLVEWQRPSVFKRNSAWIKSGRIEEGATP